MVLNCILIWLYQCWLVSSSYLLKSQQVVLLTQKFPVFPRSITTPLIYCFVLVLWAVWLWIGMKMLLSVRLLEVSESFSQQGTRTAGEKGSFYPALLCVQDNWRYKGNCFKNPGQVTHRLMTFTSRVKISLYMYLVCPVNVFFNISVFQNASCRYTTAKENLSSTRSKGGTITVVLTFERGNLLIMEDSYYYYCT